MPSMVRTYARTHACKVSTHIGKYIQRTYIYRTASWVPVVRIRISSIERFHPSSIYTLYTYCTIILHYILYNHITLYTVQSYYTIYCTIILHYILYNHITLYTVQSYYTTYCIIILHYILYNHITLYTVQSYHTIYCTIIL